MAGDSRDMDEVVDLICTLSFYWYNFMPLSRGTAMCGLICLHAMLLSVGLKVGCRCVRSCVSCLFHAFVSHLPTGSILFNYLSSPLLV